VEAEPAYIAICKTAVTTGARQGELVGLNLDDLDLLNGTLKLERHYDCESGTLTLPKDGEARTVHLMTGARFYWRSFYWRSLCTSRRLIEGGSAMLSSSRASRTAVPNASASLREFQTSTTWILPSSPIAATCSVRAEVEAPLAPTFARTASYCSGVAFVLTIRQTAMVIPPWSLTRDAKSRPGIER
jgi:hypothetical protein